MSATSNRRHALPTRLAVAIGASMLSIGAAGAAERIIATVPGADFDVGAAGSVQRVTFAVDAPVTGVGFTGRWTAVVADNQDGTAPWSVDLGVTVTSPDGVESAEWKPLGGDITIADYPLQDFAELFDGVDGQGEFEWSFSSVGGHYVAGLRDVEYHLTTEVPDVVETIEGSVADGPQWFRPYFIEGVSGLGPVVYDAVELQVSVSGGYEFESVVPTGNHFTALYRGGFDPEQPLENLLDYGIGNGFSWDGSPQGTSRISALLLEGEIYHLVASQWASNTPGQAYTTTIVGPGSLIDDGGPGEPEPDATLIMNGELVSGLEGAAGESLLFRLDVPGGAARVRFLTGGGNGNVTLYARHGEAPTVDDYDAVSSRPATNEVVTLSSPAAGAWYVRVVGESAFSGVFVRGEY